ncbi:MAG TPA: CHAT domain-containing protein [Paracoccaceae bacterium]|nr:CHAT domain-containing protein [Paracoccaceae bacterium]
MTRRTLRFAAARLAVAMAAAASLAGCAPEGSGPDGSAGVDVAGGLPAGEVCRSLGREESLARRDAFTLDFPGAERRLRTALSIYERRPDDASACPDVLGEAGALAELGLALSSQRQFRLAEAAFADAEAQTAAVVDAGVVEAGVAAEDGPERRALLNAARVAAYRAQHELNRARYDVAGAQSDAAIRLLGVGFGGFSDAAGGGLFGLDTAEFDRRVLDAASRYTQAAALSRDGDVEGARRSIESALEAAGGLPGATGALRSRIEAERAAVELSAGDAPLALALASRAADQLAGELPGTSLAARARLIEAVALARLDRREEAFAAFDEAFSIYGETPAELRFESVWPLVKLAIESERDGLISGEERDRRVFAAVQLVRSAALASDIAENAALVAAGDDAAARAIRDWQAADERVGQLYTAAARRDLIALQRQEVQRELVSALTEEARLRERRDRLAPDYVRAIQAPVTLEAVQGALRPGEIMLQILVGQPRPLVMLVSPDRVEVHASALAPETVGIVVRRLRDAAEPLPGGRLKPFDVRLASLLHDGLLGPIAEDVSAADLVFVAADGPMQSLPLEVLVNRFDPAAERRAAESLDYTGVSWLGASATFSYLPSARTLVDLRGAVGASGATRSFFGFGDFDPTDDIAAEIDRRRAEACGREVRVLRSLRALPGTKRELDLVGALFSDGRTLTQGAFTEGALRDLSDRGELSDYRILHFATHGILWPTVDCFQPALTATPGADGFDGLIESGEIRALDIDADLVVLSACQSVDPAETSTGETLQGLTRAFLGGGARAAVASHWLVRDDLAPGLMRDFYAAVSGPDRAPFAAALRGAVAPLREAPATSHPFNWAPFVVFGDGGRSLGG